MAKNLPARPNLDHLRNQAKALLADLKRGEPSAVRTIAKHLPAAHKMTPAKIRAAGFRLADAQSAIARKTGFPSWAALSRHVETLRQLEGEWQFVGLEIDGSAMPAGAFGSSRLLMDGDRFRMESPEANYDGVFSIDAEAEPMQIDIEFVEGPESGNMSYGIFALDGDQLTMCIGVVGAARPVAFASRAGSGHALERLRRASAKRPADVTGGTRATKTDATPASSAAPVDPKTFDVSMTPLLKLLEGEWSAVRLVRDGEEMRADWLPFGSRTAAGNEVKVVFGGQVMVHAKVRIDETTTPMSVDYLNLNGVSKGKISLGIMDFVGEDVRFLIGVPGHPRPASFDSPGQGQTLSQWRRRALLLS